jgi:type I restriction enzyme S subunit
MSFPAYPAYRDSGVPWLGQVPAGWSVRRLRFLADIRPSGVDKHSLEGELPVRLCNYVDVYKNDRITDALAFLEATATPAEIERFSLRAGDVLITKDSETSDDIAAEALVEASASGVVCGYHLALLRPVPGVVDGAFLFWAFKSPETLAQCTVRAQGITRFGLSSAAIGDVVLPLPPPAEQRAIAAFLDRECGKMDALVAEQERLIALLKEKRQAVISHAVTKGLDPNAPMKDSGVAWLGQVPAHWEVKRLKDIGTLVGGAGFPHEEQGREGEELPFYKVADLARAEGGRTMGDAESTISRETASALRARIIPANSIVYAKIGAALLLNRRRITTRPCCIDNNMTAFTPALERLSTLWAWYWLSIIDFGQVANPGAVPSFSEGDQEILPIALPDLNEQRAITAFLDRECSKLDTLTTEAERAIALLKERRAALISAAVTGKIDVRGLAAPAETEATAA